MIREANDLKLTFECTCGHKVETKVVENYPFGVIIRFDDNATAFGGDDSGYVYITCGKCDKMTEVGG